MTSSRQRQLRDIDTDGVADRRRQSGLAVAERGMTHSTPVVATIQGVRQVVFATQSGLVSVDPLSGSLLWRFNTVRLLPVARGLAVVYQNMVFVCGAHAYNMGSVVMQASLTNGTWTTGAALVDQ